MLTLPEQVLLMMLDARQQSVGAFKERFLRGVLCGAVLMRLAFKNRIDTDQHNLFVVDDTPIGDAVPDAVLLALASHPVRLSIREALERVIRQFGTRIRDELVTRLCSRGTLAVSTRRILGIVPRREYVVADSSEVEALKTHLREVIMDDGVPDPHDAVLISLLDAGCVMPRLFSEEERQAYWPRVKSIARLDFVGQNLAAAIRPIQNEMALVMAAYCPAGCHPV
jgi:hypothetical protein